MMIILGLQAVTFAVISRRFASRYGFIPRSETFDRLLEALTLERILLGAVALVLIGLATLVWAMFSWATTGFTDLLSDVVLRIIVVSLTSLVAGIQLMMSAFMASILNIPLLEQRVAASPPHTHESRRRTDVEPK
jgi:hypothetical protein